MDCKVSTDWMYRGMRTLIMENEFLRVVVLLDKGSDIIELKYKPKDLNMLLERERGHINPKILTFITPANLSMVDVFGGGWTEALPNAGSPCEYKGVQFGLHGEVPLLPFRCFIEEETNDLVRAKLSVTLIRYPMKLEKWLEIRKGEKSLRIKEKLTNLSPEDLEFSWLQHICYGQPFLEPGNKITIKEGKVITPSEPFSPTSRLKEGTETNWPMAKAKDGGDVDLSVIPSKELNALDLCYIVELDEPWYTLYNKNLKLGIGVRCSKEVYRCIWFWQNYWGSGYPWWSKLWNIELGFCTSYGSGLEEQNKFGNTMKISGNSSIEASIITSVYEDIENVNEVTEEGEVI